jgi:predicted transcriptional regulator
VRWIRDKKLESKTNKKENPKPFERIFHNATARVLDFLIVSKGYDYTESEIARRTGLTPKRVSRELENLVSENIVKKTRKIGKSNMYILNDVENVSGLVQYVDDTIKMEYKGTSQAS